jgi:NAD(P)-dependent dehydrogenase (short-subunit alcohol dehydrogenase family)
MRGSKWRLPGRSILITGAAEGIGAATARLLAAREMHLSLLDVQGSALQKLANDLGGAAIWQQVDVTQREALEAAVTATLERFGQIDMVLVNAGVVTVGSVERGDPQAFERVIAVNLLGAWQTVRAVLPHVIAARGYILFVSSIAGSTQGPLHAAYNSSKAGLQAFANTLRLEVEGLGVDVGVAHLIYTATETARGAVEHPLIRGLPGLRMMKPQPVEETAAMLVRGIERRSRTVVIPAARLALLTPDVFQLVVERMARRHRWAATIREQERAGEGRDVSQGTPMPVVIEGRQEESG